MKRLGTIAVCLAGGMTLNASQHADDLAVANNPPSGNPYAQIAVRNVFGLVPPPPPPDPTKDRDKDLPKITLTGIQHFPGVSPQALFKVSPKPGTSGKDQYYTLNQGERQDDVEVLGIDEVNNVVTFENHGITQEVALAEAKATGGGGAPAGPAGMNPGGRPPGFTGGGPAGNPSGIIRFGEPAGGRITTADGSTSGFNSGMGPGGVNPADTPNSLQSHIYQPPASQMSPEATVIAIEAKRAELMNNPHPPYSPNLLPPTTLTQFNTPGGENTGQQ